MTLKALRIPVIMLASLAFFGMHEVKARKQTTTTLMIASCLENRDTRELLELGKTRALEKYYVEDFDQYIDYKKLADRLIKELNKTYDAECRAEI